MTAPVTPYTTFLGDRDPLEAFRDSIARIEILAREWTADRFERSYAPGKWSARQVLTHLAQTELALGSRARMALSTPGYVAQPFDQDQWIPFDANLGGREAADAFVATARMNLACFASLSDAQRAVGFSHPEYGELTVDWVIHQMAGHHVNHLRQLEHVT
jgi:hypothetical protein